jgi:hypothetical protein
MIMLALALGQQAATGGSRTIARTVLLRGKAMQIVEQRHVSIDLSPGASVEPNACLPGYASRVEPDITIGSGYGDKQHGQRGQSQSWSYQQAQHGRIPDGHPVSRVSSPIAIRDRRRELQGPGQPSYREFAFFRPIKAGRPDALLAASAAAHRQTRCRGMLNKFAPGEMPSAHGRRALDRLLYLKGNSNMRTPLPPGRQP